MLYVCVRAILELTFIADSSRSLLRLKSAPILAAVVMVSGLSQAAATNTADSPKPFVALMLAV